MKWTWLPLVEWTLLLQVRVALVAVLAAQVPPLCGGNLETPVEESLPDDSFNIIYINFD
jgi:hypothetical protein